MKSLDELYALTALLDTFEESATTQLAKDVANDCKSDVDCIIREVKEEENE